ncbi:MAG: hypothetical protein HYY40_14660 [Bacteroidetes bacterium]|nr:hypothetical protein [Bacteroidota bacterium]
MIFFLILFLLPVFSSCQSQPLAAYSDYRNYFYIWDNGTARQVEYLPVKEFKINYNTVFYYDNTGILKVYRNGTVSKVGTRNNQLLAVTDNLAVIGSGSILSVFDNGKLSELSINPGRWSVSDSIVVFMDNLTGYFKMYYNGKITELEDALLENPVTGYTVGKNIFAYHNRFKEYKIFYRDSFYSPVTWGDMIRCSAGRNILGFWDNNDLTFKIFYKGEIFPVENEQPAAFSAGDDILAYILKGGNFRIYYDGKIIEILPFRPDFYKVEDGLVVFGEKSQFKCFSKGKSYTLENFIPSTYKYDGNSVVWLDQSGYLKSFYNGAIETITIEKIKTWDLIRDVIMYTTLSNENHVVVNK